MMLTFLGSTENIPPSAVFHGIMDALMPLIFAQVLDSLFSRILGGSRKY